MSTEGTALADPDPAATADPSSARQAPGDQRSFRLAVFGAVLVVVASIGFGVGRLTGRSAAPADGGGPASAALHDGVTATVTDESVPHAHGAAPGDPAQPAAARPGAAQSGAADAGGLALSAAGLTLVPESTILRAGAAQPLRFRIVGAGGVPVTTFAVVHDKPMHLVVVRRDLTGYQHLHPSMAADGTWSTPLTVGAPGTWRAYADFTAVLGERQVPATLGIDLSVPGAYTPRPLPSPATIARVRDFEVGYAGAPQVGSVQPLLVTVTTAGAPAPLEPYLGAYGHLVVLREGDLAYLHVHPEPQLVAGAVKFWLAAPSPGRYRMFLDFQVAGTVHTAAFTATVR
ncbi:MAG TPA: hypothetical protein VFO77_06030 [Actinoplanes sp.]|nr:hypothetical protein [Actinoplanes sp.]